MSPVLTPIVQRWIRDGLRDPEGFWGRAAEQLPWFRKWDKVFDWQYPTFQWFGGGRTNIAYNCLDHHVAHGRGGQAALIYANERGERQVFTYAQMMHEVERIAAALRGMGIEKGDRIAVYMPLTPEAVMLMLAIVRIGAIHMVVFAGFGAGALADRIKASGARLLFAADVTLRKGKDVPLKGLVDAALEQGCDSIEHCIVLRRRADAMSMKGKPFRGRRETAPSPREPKEGATSTGRSSWRKAPARAARTSRWSRTRRRSSWRLRAPPPSQSWPSTRTAATRCISTAWAAGCSG